jgi:prevent-host-death family protein
MASFTIHQAKTNLSRLIAQAESGEEVVITRGKDPVVRLVAVSSAKQKPGFGMLKGKIPDLPDEFFFAPLPEEELRLWEGEDETPL